MSKIVYERSIIELIEKSNSVYLPIFSVSLKLNELNKMTFGDSKILNANLWYLSLDSIIDNDIFVSA